MNVPRCRYIKTNGLVCKSPSLTGRTYCYFHTRLNDRNYVYRIHQENQPVPVTGAIIPIAGLEDTESVQLALSVVINALCVGDLEPARARAILYGLQLASNNARHMKTELPATPDVARAVVNLFEYEPAAPAGAHVVLLDGPATSPSAPETPENPSADENVPSARRHGFPSLTRLTPSDEPPSESSIPAPQFLRL